MYSKMLNFIIVKSGMKAKVRHSSLLTPLARIACTFQWFLIARCVSVYTFILRFACYQGMGMGRGMGGWVGREGGFESMSVGFSI